MPEINTNMTFAGIDSAKLPAILKEYNVSQVVITKILQDPSLYPVSDVITDPVGASKVAEIATPSAKTTAPLEEENLSAFEKNVQMLFSIMSDQSKFQSLMNKLSLSANVTALESTKLGNEKIADSEKTNAIAGIVSGVVSMGFSAYSMKVGAGPTSKNGVEATSAPSVESLSAKAMAFQQIGTAIGGVSTGIAGIVAADQKKEGQNTLAEADFIKTAAQALAAAASDLRSQMDTSAGAVGNIQSFIQSVARN
jgi:hypothetical protein